MAPRFWNTMAVENIDRANAFYQSIGFTTRPMPGGAGLVVCPDENSTICAFTHEVFRSMLPGDVCDTARAHEIIQSVSADDRAGVDALMAKAAAAGGRTLGPASEKPFGYLGAFADPDGHIWSVLWLANSGG